MRKKTQHALRAIGVPRRKTRKAGGILLAVPLVMAGLTLASGMWTLPAADAGGSGEFIVRCPMTGEVQPVDPIMAPGVTAPHVHMFFGNADVQPTSTYADLNNPADESSTSCEDPNDTAAYWAPEPFLKTTPNGTPTPYLPAGRRQRDRMGLRR